MTFNELPSCCGIRLHTGFGNTSATLSADVTPEQVDEYLKKSTSSIQGNMAVLNTEQIAILGQTFKDNGFEVIKEFYYNGHGNNIYILMKLHEVNNKPKIFLT